jgi:hypothetical protein
MRDGRSATPRFNAAVDVARVQSQGQVARRKRRAKAGFFSNLAYKKSITRLAIGG